MYLYNNIAPGQKRVVVIGGGFAGLKLINSLKGSDFHVLLLDKVNYHQFQPLMYQVATSALEPSAIAFPFRKDLQRMPNFSFRLTSVTAVNPERHTVTTSIGEIGYDYLVIATGTQTSYYGMENVRANALPMKSVADALLLRNSILDNLEKALTLTDNRSLLNIVVCGGGATGVEIAGALSEMKRFVFRKDYPELRELELNIYLVEGSDRLLRSMSPRASQAALDSLRRMGVEVLLETAVADYDNSVVSFRDGRSIPSETLIWVSGVAGERIVGLPDQVWGRGNRILADQFNRVQGVQDVFVIGDIALQHTPEYADGYAQLAPVAIAQGRNLARNLRNLARSREMVPFKYTDKGTMATIGRGRAVVMIRGLYFQGYMAWIVWLVVHLLSILGVKNKLQTMLNWTWNYWTFDQSLRLIIRPSLVGKKKT